MNLSDLMLARSEEQMRARWKDPDPDEYRGPHFCFVCDVEVFPTNDAKGAAIPKLCPGCRAEGWTAALCPGCKGHVKRADQTGPRGDRRGYCKTCRAAWDAFRPLERRAPPPWLRRK